MIIKKCQILKFVISEIRSITMIGPLLYFEIFDNQHDYDKILVSVSRTHFSL